MTKAKLVVTTQTCVRFIYLEPHHHSQLKAALQSQ